MDKYIKVKTVVENNNCKLLTSFEEFEEKRKNILGNSYQFVRIDFIEICSHISSAVFTNFNLLKT
jgi:uncharacterized protein YjfI (DUF2170 family)